MKDFLDKLMAYEAGEMDEEEVVAFFQSLYDEGVLGRLQGSYQRTFQSLLEAGLVIVKENT